MNPHYSEETPAVEVQKEAEEECDAAPPFVVSWPGATEEQLAERESEIHCYRQLTEVAIPREEMQLALWKGSGDLKGIIEENLAALKRQAAEQLPRLLTAPAAPKRKPKKVGTSE